MTAKRMWIPLVTIVAVAALVFLLARGDGDDGGAQRGPSGAVRVSTRVDPHPRLHLRPAERDRILHAAAEVTAAMASAELVSEGRRLFRSVPAGKPGESCQACHTEGGGTGNEGSVTRLGEVIHSTDRASGLPSGFDGPRDAPALWNAKLTAPYGWTGDQPTIEDFVISAIKTHFADENPTAERVAALSAFVRTMLPPVTAFDLGTMSAAAQRGQQVFDGKGGCKTCHGAPLFTDRERHDLGVPESTGAHDPGPFDTPQLRDVRNTPPYMHNGVLKTLEQVVDFYDRDATTGALGLTDQEKADLLAFLRSL
jgi:cytochrome c peroxidase